MFNLKPWPHSEVREFISRQSGSSFSYPEVGATASSPPRHYNVDHTRIQLGSGSGIWRRAVDAVRAWQMFNIPWLKLCWPNCPIQVGTDVAVMVRHFGFWSLNACRIVYVVEDETFNRRQYGFAYGTLDEHAERGEERFTVEWNLEDDSVWYDILAFSRPRMLLAILGYPLSRSLQRKFAAASKVAMLAAACPLLEADGYGTVNCHFVPEDATIAELEKKASEHEQKAAVADEPLAAELRQVAKLCREWVAALRSGRWTS